MLSDNQGDAADAFDETVQELIDPRKGTLTHALQACEQLQQACANQAQAIRDIKRELEFLLVELVATFIIGQVVSAITFESAQVASDAITAGMIGRIAKLISDFTRGVIEISSAMDKAIAGVIAKGIVGARTGVYAGGLTAGANYAISEAFGKKPDEGTAILRQILESGGLGAFGGSFTASAGELSTTLRNLGEEGGVASSTLIALSGQLKSGSITVAAANNALQQLIQNGKIEPARYVSAVTSARLQTALQPHTGKHAR